MSKAAGHDEPGAVAAALGKGLTARREHDRLRLNATGGGRKREAVAGWRDIQHAPAGQKRGANAAGFPEERVEHVARAVSVGKELAAGFFVNVHAELAEKCDRRVHRKRA